MPEKHLEQFREVAGARDETVPKAEKPKGEVIWSPEATAKGRELAGEISRLYAKAKDLEEQGDLSDIRNTYAEINSLILELEALIEKESPKVIRAKTPEGREIIFDMKEIREHWATFYQNHNLPEMAESLPEIINLTPEQIARIERLAEQEGFNHFLLLPQNPDQYLPKIKQETSKPLEGLPEQYIKDGIYLLGIVRPSFPDQIKTQNRPEKKAYLVFQKASREVDKKTKNKSAKTLCQELKEKDLHGLTLTEYLLFQRDYTAQNKTHPDQSSWAWLLDSELASGEVLVAHWYSGDRQVRIVSRTPDSPDPFLGCRSSAILEI